MHYCTNEPAAWRCELLAWLPYRVCTPYFVLVRGGQERAAKQGTPRIASFTAFRNTTKSCVIQTHMKAACGDRGSRSQSTTATTDALGTQRASYTSEGPSPHKLPQGSERTRGQNQRRKYPQNVFNSNGSKRPLCLVKDFLTVGSGALSRATRPKRGGNGASAE